MTKKNTQKTGHEDRSSLATMALEMERTRVISNWSLRTQSDSPKMAVHELNDTQVSKHKVQTIGIHVNHKILKTKDN